MITIRGSEEKSSFINDLIPLLFFLFNENDIADTTSQCEQEFNVPLITLGDVFNLGFAVEIVPFSVDWQWKALTIWIFRITRQLLETLGDLTWFLLCPGGGMAAGPQLVQYVQASDGECGSATTWKVRLHRYKVSSEHECQRICSVAHQHIDVVTAGIK